MKWYCVHSDLGSFPVIGKYTKEQVQELFPGHTVETEEEFLSWAMPVKEK